MIRQYLLFFGLLGLFFQCNQTKKEAKKIDKIEQIFAENTYGFGTSVKLSIYSDSTYDFTIIDESSNHQKIEKFNGICFIKKDTIYFSPLEFEYTDSKKAILNNNFIEFIAGKYPLKLKVKKSTITIKQTIDLGQLDAYSIFTFDKKFHNYFEEDVKPYQLTQKDIIELDKVLEKCFEDNKLNLSRKSNQYSKQIIAVINPKNNIEVCVNCNCKDSMFKDEFECQIIQVHDGGNCHFRLKINLTKKNYSKLSINGLA